MGYSSRGGGRGRIIKKQKVRPYSAPQKNCLFLTFMPFWVQIKYFIITFRLFDRSSTYNLLEDFLSITIVRIAETLQIRILLYRLADGVLAKVELLGKITFILI